MHLDHHDVSNNRECASNFFFIVSALDVYDCLDEILHKSLQSGLGVSFNAGSEWIG